MSSNTNNLRPATQLEGYQAAAIVIEKWLDDAQKKCPKRTLNINRRSKEYRAGAFNAFMAAHCALVYGEFPNQPDNLKEIRKVLK